jgi:hypothetical protein
VSFGVPAVELLRMWTQFAASTESDRMNAN